MHGSPRSRDENDDGRCGTFQDDWHIHLGAHRGILARDRVSARRHHRAVRSGACRHEHHRGSGKDPGPERWREIRCRKQSRWLESVERCGGESHSVCTGPGTSVEIGFGKTLGHSDPASALGDSLGGRVRGVPLEPVRSGPRREDRVRTLERQEGENAWD